MGACKRGNWSAQELARLKDLYPRCSVARTAQLLRRSQDSVRRRARALFAGPPVLGAWTAEEDSRLRLGYGVHDVGTLSWILRRAESDVVARVEELRGVRRRGAWSRDELGLLKQIYGTRADEDLEVCLSRSVAQIRRKAEELCLSKDKRFVAGSNGGIERSRMPRWTAREVRRLATLYPHHDNLDIARMLGRTVTGVANKANQMGLRKSEAALRAMGRRNVAGRYGR